MKPSRRLWRWIATMAQVESFATGYAVGLSRGHEQAQRTANTMERNSSMLRQLNVDLLQERDALWAELRRVRMGER